MREGETMSHQWHWFTLVLNLFGLALWLYLPWRFRKTWTTGEHLQAVEVVLVTLFGSYVSALNLYHGV